MAKSIKHKKEVKIEEDPEEESSEENPVVGSEETEDTDFY